MFQRAEELLVRARLFDGLQIKLCAGPNDELGFPARADGGGEAYQIAAMLKWPPRMEIAGQEKECIGAIEEIGRVCAIGLFDLDKFLS